MAELNREREREEERPFFLGRAVVMMNAHAPDRSLKGESLRQLRERYPEHSRKEWAVGREEEEKNDDAVYNQVLFLITQSWQCPRGLLPHAERYDGPGYWGDPQLLPPVTGARGGSTQNGQLHCRS